MATRSQMSMREVVAALLCSTFYFELTLKERLTLVKSFCA